MRTEQINISGSREYSMERKCIHHVVLYDIISLPRDTWSFCPAVYRNKVKYWSFLHKRTNTNPAKGPFHFRAPSRMLWRTVRGMLPHKTPRGQAALQRLKVFEGVPPPFDKMKRVVVPDALRVRKLKIGREYCVLGRLASEVGWKHGDLIAKLETDRKVAAEAWYQKKLEQAKVAAAEKAKHA